VILGGFETSADGMSAVVVAAEDNLLKGAAVQAVQNLNLALGLPEFEGLVG
jgi:N-acetyl-gamma-glutamyl-phosphate reductase